MFGFIVTIAVGILCIGIGISNRKGNIETLHSYHRNRVSEEDRIPFGKQVGLGMIIVGVGIMLFGGLSIVSVLTERSVLAWIGTAVMILGIVLGTGISFHAMIKYNKGIF